MKLYTYNKFTFEYIGEEEANLDPLESQLQHREIYVVPPYTTPIQPIQAVEGKAVVFNEEENKWELVADYRGQVIYNKVTKEPMTLIKLGEIPNGYVLELPFSLQEAKIEKIKELNKIYEEAKISKIKVLNKVYVNIEDRFKLLEAVKGLDDEHNEYYFDTEEEAVLLTKSEIEEIAEKLYERSLALPVKKNELLAEIKSCRGKKKLEEIIEKAKTELK